MVPRTRSSWRDLGKDWGVGKAWTGWNPKGVPLVLLMPLLLQPKAGWCSSGEKMKLLRSRKRMRWSPAAN